MPRPWGFPLWELYPFHAPILAHTRQSTLHRNFFATESKYRDGSISDEFTAYSGCSPTFEHPIPTETQALQYKSPYSLAFPTVLQIS